MDKTKPSLRTQTGKVVGASMQKSARVAIERRIKHPLYGKYLTRTTKVIVHDEDNQCQLGDLVTIAACRPMSKHKHWRLIDVVERASVR